MSNFLVSDKFELMTPDGITLIRRNKNRNKWETDKRVGLEIDNWDGDIWAEETLAITNLDDKVHWTPNNSRSWETKAEGRRGIQFFRNTNDT